jgi:hypothetical protein
MRHIRRNSIVKVPTIATIMTINRGFLLDS